MAKDIKPLCSGVEASKLSFTKKDIVLPFQLLKQKAGGVWPAPEPLLLSIYLEEALPPSEWRCRKASEPRADGRPPTGDTPRGPVPPDTGRKPGGPFCPDLSYCTGAWKRALETWLLSGTAQCLVRGERRAMDSASFYFIIILSIELIGFLTSWYNITSLSTGHSSYFRLFHNLNGQFSLNLP